MKTAEIQTGPSAKSVAGDVHPPVEPGAIDAGGEDVAADGAAVEPTAVIENAVERERHRVETLLESDGINHAEVRAEVQETMTDNVNVFREEDSLEQALRDIRQARVDYEDVAVADPSRTYNTDLIHTIETRNILDVAEAITLGALAREEFRGAHWRAEHQERKDDEWIKHTMLAWNDGTPELYYKPVILEGDEQTYEPKERSY
jgi:succinate dehydrogenase / fumarate reductase flavoprotein subunit